MVRLGQTHGVVCTTWLGIGADRVSGSKHVGLVIFLVRLGQKHVLAFATRLGVGAHTVRCRCRHSKWV